MNSLMAFGYYGGKAKLSDEIIDLVPYDGITTYIEPFGGSAAVLINKIPHAAEIYSDAAIGLCCFFDVLSRADTSTCLIDELYRTEYSNNVFQYNKDLIFLAERQKYQMEDLTADERFNLAVGCFVIYTQSRDNAGLYWGGEGRFPSDDSYLRTVDRLNEVAERVEGLTVIHATVFDLITQPRFNRSDVVFYLDPPYLAAEDREDKRSPSAYYRHRLMIEQHKKLLRWARTTHSRVLISGYSDETRLYDRYLCEGEGLRGRVKQRFIPWNRLGFESRSVVSKHDNKRIEIIWSNHNVNYTNEGCDNK